jgi:NAD binding domain of 6-phosphogluconate dehydrogenase
MPEIGLVGLGRMGLPICANLVQAAYRVLVGDRRPGAARQAAGHGARWIPEPARLAAEADVLITVLPGPGEVRELMLGTGGAAAALRHGTTWIDMTSLGFPRFWNWLWTYRGGSFTRLRRPDSPAPRTAPCRKQRQAFADWRGEC